MSNPVEKRKIARQQARLRQAAQAGLTHLPCEARYAAMGLTHLQARLICCIIENGDDPIIAASNLNIDVRQLNREFSNALEAMHGQ